jgi:hypothetical protein
VAYITKVFTYTGSHKLSDPDYVIWYNYTDEYLSKYGKTLNKLHENGAGIMGASAIRFLNSPRRNTVVGDSKRLVDLGDDDFNDLLDHEVGHLRSGLRHVVKSIRHFREIAERGDIVEMNRLYVKEEMRIDKLYAPRRYELLKQHGVYDDTDLQTHCGGPKMFSRDELIGLPKVPRITDEQLRYGGLI